MFDKAIAFKFCFEEAVGGLFESDFCELEGRARILGGCPAVESSFFKPEEDGDLNICLQILTLAYYSLLIRTYSPKS